MVSEQAAWDSDHFRFSFHEAENVSSVWESSLEKSLGKIGICLFFYRGAGLYLDNPWKDSHGSLNLNGLCR